MLQGYFDESGTHDGERLVVAGFVVDSKNISRFEVVWKAALKEYGVPFFKAQWFDKRKEFFRAAQWQDSNRRKGFIGSLLAALSSASVKSMSCSVEFGLFNEVVPTGKVRNRLGSAYTLCCQRCMQHAMKTAVENSVTERVNYWFDAGHKNWKELQEAFERETEESRDRALLGFLAFADERSIAALQAADLLAYELALYQRGKHHRYPLHPIVDNPIKHTEWSREALIRLRNRFCPQLPFIEL